MRLLSDALKGVFDGKSRAYANELLETREL